MAVTRAERDHICLLHVRDEARHAPSFVKRETRASLDNDTMLAHAVEMCLRLIGVNASSLSEDFRAAHPQIAWHEFIDVSEHIISDYCNIDSDRVWETIQVSIPALIAELEKLLPPEIDDGI